MKMIEHLFFWVGRGEGNYNLLEKFEGVYKINENLQTSNQLIDAAGCILLNFVYCYNNKKNQKFKSDNLTNIDKYRVTANITEYHNITKLMQS